MVNETFELDIQPHASILNVFSRLNYKSWNAIAEFVDNSTQSYFTHKDTLTNISNFEKLSIYIEYDSVKKTLTIRDNAFGMEYDRFVDAIRLDSKHSEQRGRNEFGMGLKTAASWFGNIWSVTSSQYGSSNKYTATIDIPALKKSDLNSIQIHKCSADLNEHGTVIQIREITKNINTRTQKKIRNLLASMYRRDILEDDIDIYFNGEKIYFKPYPILTFRDKTWKKSVDFNFDFDGVNHHVTGFVAIMNPGSFVTTGFALFRRNRVVIGGDDQNYKPKEIFKQAQSQISLKLFGELNLDDFPIDQAKDGFIWEDGLEETFIQELINNIHDYIKIAELSSKERETEESYSQDHSNEVHKITQDAINNLNNNDSEKDSEKSNLLDNINDPANSNGDSGDTEDLLTYKEKFIENSQNNDEIIIDHPRTYTIPINKITNKTIHVSWSICDDDYWIDYTQSNNNEIIAKINIDHPFFKPYSKQKDFQTVLEKFVIAFIIAEEEAKQVSNQEGYVLEETVIKNMNRNLKKMSEGY